MQAALRKYMFLQEFLRGLHIPGPLIFRSFGILGRPREAVGTAYG